MYKILIATHGRLCEGLKDTISLFSADIDRITVIPFYTEEKNGDSLLKEYMDNVQKQDTVVIFTDIAGGSVNQKMLPYIDSHIHLITGVNLPVLLEFLCMNADEISAETVRDKMKSIQESLMYMNDIQIDFAEDDE